MIGNFGASVPSAALRPIYPGAYDDRWLVSVGANGTDGTIAIEGQNVLLPDNYGSNYGLDMDLIAPGVQFDDNQLSMVTTTSKLTNTTYTTFSGTSAALPHVTATAAMLMLHHPTDLAQEDVEHLLEYNATDIGLSDGYEVGYEDENGKCPRYLRF